jgi:hypothetical protein
MANLRSQLRTRQGLSVDPVPPAKAGPQGKRRWRVVIGVGATLLLLALAWAEGGEQPLRPIAEPVQLPELPR